MFIDPYHRQMYELDMKIGSPTPQGISLQMSKSPDVYTYDSVEMNLYWVDTVASAIKTQPLDYRNREKVVQILPSSELVFGPCVQIFIAQIRESSSFLLISTTQIIYYKCDCT